MYRARFKRWGLGKRNKSASTSMAVRPKKQHHMHQQPQSQTLPQHPPQLGAQQPHLVLHGVNTILDSAQIDEHHGRQQYHHLYHQWYPLPYSRTQSPSSSSSSSALTRTPSPEPVYLRAPDHLQSAENMYRAIRDYYTASFSAGRWSFEEDLSPAERPSAAVLQTRAGVLRGFEIWRRFGTALRLFHDPRRPDNRAQSIKIIRICFAELTATLLSERESPLLLIWVMHVLIMLRGADPPGSAGGMQRVERFLLRHLYELTEAGGSTGGIGRGKRGGRHPTSILWQVLWGGGKGVFFGGERGDGMVGSGPGADYHHLRTCIDAAADQFALHSGKMHKRTVELRSLSIFCRLPMFHPDAEEQLRQFRALFAEVQALGVFDGRDLDVRAWLAAHLSSMGRLDEAAELMEELLQSPQKWAVVESTPEAMPCLNLLIGSIRLAQGRMADAERHLRIVTDVGRVAWAESNEDVHLSDGLLALDECLRAQGRLAEAEEAIAEHRLLLSKALEKRGERDSV